MLRRTSLAAVGSLLAACAGAAPSLEGVEGAESAAAVAEVASAPVASNQSDAVPNVTTGGQPTEEQLRAAAEQGYVAVVRVRGEGEPMQVEEAALAAELGLAYHHIPLSSPDDLDAERVGKLSAILKDAGGPVLLHCSSGNRAAAILALQRRSEGLSADEALQIGQAAGLTRWEDAVRTKFEQPAE